MLPNRRLRVHFVFENLSLVDFQIGNERKGRQTCRALMFLHIQRFPRGRDRILSTQRFPRGRDRIFSTQRIFYKKNHEKSMVCFKIFRAARANLLRIS